MTFLCSFCPSLSLSSKNMIGHFKVRILDSICCSQAQCTATNSLRSLIFLSVRILFYNTVSLCSFRDQIQGLLQVHPKTFHWYFEGIAMNLYITFGDVHMNFHNTDYIVDEHRKRGGLFFNFFVFCSCFPWSF